MRNLILIMILFLVGCGAEQKVEQPKPEQPKAKPIGQPEQAKPNKTDDDMWKEYYASQGLPTKEKPTVEAPKNIPLNRQGVNEYEEHLKSLDAQKQKQAEEEASKKKAENWQADQLIRMRNDEAGARARAMQRNRDEQLNQ